MSDKPQYDADGLTKDVRPQALERQIGEELFGLHGASRILHAPWYARDWNAIPRLIEQCVKRDWGLELEYTPTVSESWFVFLQFDDGSDEYNACEAYGNSLPEALCRAIVAVLDALEETKKEMKARDA